MYRLQNVLKFMKFCIYRKQDFNSVFLDFYIFFCNSDRSFYFYKTCGFYFYCLPLFYTIQLLNVNGFIPFYPFACANAVAVWASFLNIATRFCFSSVVYCFRFFLPLWYCNTQAFFCYEGRIDGYLRSGDSFFNHWLTFRHHRKYI